MSGSVIPLEVSHSKQLSAIGLNCRYLNTYQIKAYRACYQTVPKMTARCERPNHLLKATSQCEFCFSLIECVPQFPDPNAKEYVCDLPY